MYLFYFVFLAVNKPACSPSDDVAITIENCICGATQAVDGENSDEIECSVGNYCWTDNTCNTDVKPTSEPTPSPTPIGKHISKKKTLECFVFKLTLVCTDIKFRSPLRLLNSFCTIFFLFFHS